MNSSPGKKGSRVERRKSLELLEMFLHTDIVTLIQSSFVRIVATGFFFENKDDFHTNPANTLLHQSLQALEERAIVHISETLKDENALFNLPAGNLPGTLDLEFHRHALSHPRTIRWRKRGMQQFFDAKRRWKDNRPAIVWDLHRSINKEMVKVGLTPKLTSVPVTYEMAILVSSILRCSVKAESLPTIPPEMMLLEWMEQERDKWLKILEQIRPSPA
jgi:hypothetical protein